jgi:predicted O-methyltransferase YrrM
LENLANSLEIPRYTQITTRVTKDFPITPWFLQKIQETKMMVGSFQLVYQLILLTNSRSILELGLGSEGISTYIFIEALKLTGGKLITVEKREEFNYNYGHFNTYDRNIWTLIHGDDLEVKFDEPFDMIMLDTSHEEEQTEKELARYHPLLRTGGYLLMHDTELPGVINPLNRFMLNHAQEYEIAFSENWYPQLTILRKVYR